MRIGIDLGGTKIEAVVLADDGNVAVRRRVPTPAHDYDAIILAMAKLVADVEREAGGKMLSVGVGIPGTISPATGLVKNANSTVLIGHPLDRDLAIALKRPVRVANDANCFALSEAADGAAARLAFPERPAVVFGVILGTGVGGGVVVDGKVLVGPNGIAGEFGHMPLPWPKSQVARLSESEVPGPACYCGKYGCNETWLSGPSLARDHERVTGQKRSTAEISAAALQGDVEAEQTMQRYEDRLARALACVLNVLDPDVVVLGGGVSNIDRLYTNVAKLWGQYTFSDTVRTRLVKNHHGDSSGVRGAAWLWPAAKDQ